MSDDLREVVQQLMFKENKSLLTRKEIDVISVQVRVVFFQFQKKKYMCTSCCSR